MRKKIFSLVAIILAVSMALASCGTNAGSGGSGGGSSAPAPVAGSGSDSAPAAPASERSKTFTVVTGDNMVQVDPHNLTAQGDNLVQSMCYEPLIYTDHAGTYTGILAESWEIAEDWTSMTFKLREGIKFTNGEDWNADQAVYNIERGIAHKNDFTPFMIYLGSLESVEKIDDYNIKINFSQPFLDVMSQIPRILFIPMGAHQELGDQMFADMNQIGTGPWIFDEWVSGQYAHLTKNPDYWDKANYDPYFEDGYVRFVTEPTSAAGAMISGEADVYSAMGGIGYDVLALYEGTENDIEIKIITETTSYADLKLGFPGDDATWYDDKAREALNLCIDRQSLADNMFLSGRVPVGIFPEGVKFGYSTDIAPYEYDPEKAKLLLTESSYDGRELSLISQVAGVNAEDYALAFASMMEEVGFNVNLEVLEQAAFNDKMFAGEWDIMVHNNMYNDGNVASFLEPRYINDYSQAGMAGDDAEFLIDQCKAFMSEFDTEKRNQIAVDINRWMRDWNGPELAVAMYNFTMAQRYGITGVIMYPDSFWYIKWIDWDPSLVKA